jgi:hypothetical protein
MPNLWRRLVCFVGVAAMVGCANHSSESIESIPLNNAKILDENLQMLRDIKAGIHALANERDKCLSDLSEQRAWERNHCQCDEPAR